MGTAENWKVGNSRKLEDRGLQGDSETGLGNEGFDSAQPDKLLGTAENWKVGNSRKSEDSGPQGDCRVDGELQLGNSPMTEDR